MILIPIKNLSTTKQRLSSVLDQPARTELARAMLLDVLQAVAKCSAKQAAIVTTDLHATRLAQEFNFETIADNNVSETAAIEFATQVCESRGIESTLVIPGDIPLITAQELDQILEAAPQEGSVLVPAADGRGTNAAFRRPAGLFPLRFGNDSFKPHLEAARATQKPCVVLSLPGIALDIDNPKDLRQLLESPGDTYTQGLLRAWNRAGLPLAVNQ
jgi:2-phospho-L-lactate guanylyltransferase